MEDKKDNGFLLDWNVDNSYWDKRNQLPVPGASKTEDALESEV